MKNKATTSKAQKHRKFLLLMPLLVLPFVTVMAWAMGVGKQSTVLPNTAEKKGFNFKLPDPVKDDKAMDKMSYYDQAKLDSAKFQELIKNDPNYQQQQEPLAYDSDQFHSTQINGLNGNGGRNNLNTSLYNNRNYNDPNSEHIYRKLSELDQEMRRPQSGVYGAERFEPGYSRNTQVNSSDVDRLEQMMQMMSQKEGDDPEMQQINGVLERILDIQHPDRVQDKLKQNSENRRGQIYAVTAQQQSHIVSMLDENQTSNPTGIGFFSFDNPSSTMNGQNAIQAVIHETQVIVNGSTVKLRLLNDVFINGVTIPKDNFLFGTASLTGERLAIKINSVRYGNSLYPVEMTVYDMDGLDGLYIPGAITRDVAKESADRSMQNIGIGSMDPSWGAQAASAGIEAAKTLIGKKVKLIKVIVKAGYQVLLRDEKQKQNTITQ